MPSWKEITDNQDDSPTRIITRMICLLLSQSVSRTTLVYYENRYLREAPSRKWLISCETWDRFQDCYPMTYTKEHMPQLRFITKRHEHPILHYGEI